MRCAVPDHHRLRSGEGSWTASWHVIQTETSPPNGNIFRSWDLIPETVGSSHDRDERH